MISAFFLWLLDSAFYVSGLAGLPSWMGMVNAGCLCSIQSEIFSKMKFIIFQCCPTKLPFYLSSQLHLISPLFSHFIDHEITLNILEFILNSIEKAKPGFSFSSMCIFPELNETKFRYFADQNGRAEVGHHENDF